jgi:hypothetical protein
LFVIPQRSGGITGPAICTAAISRKLDSINNLYLNTELGI